MHPDFPQTSFRFVLGAGYDNHVHKLSDDEACKIKVVTDIKRVSDALSDADLAIT